MVDISKRLDKQDIMIEELKKKKKIRGYTNPHSSKSRIEERLDKLEMMLKNSSPFNDQFIDKESWHIDLGEKFPKDVDLKDLPRLKGTENSYNHVRNFKTILMLRGIDSKLFDYLFPLTLEGGAGA